MNADLSIVIPTYGRDAVLVGSIRSLLALSKPADELLVIDQSESHDTETESFLSESHRDGCIRWIRHTPPGHIGALNRGLKEAHGHIVLFLDDDILPGPELVSAHRHAHGAYTEAWAVVGQVLQPGQEAASFPRSQEFANASPMRRDLDFRFNSNAAAWVENVMTGNLSVRRDRIIALGGFDSGFIPPISFRAETDLAKRIIAAGGRIIFEPRASLRHLRVERGGTRIHGSHLASISPLHGVGDYYYALKHGKGWDRARYIIHRPFREIRTRFHLRHPWWIPVKFVGELRAIGVAWRLYRQGPKLL